MKINIAPSINYLHSFERMNYKMESALSEFIDNSTASYFNHKKELRSLNDNYNLNIYIIHDRQNDCLFIIDNAFGIEDYNIERTLQLQVPPENNARGRNQFGVGLKSSSFWMGKKLEVYSVCPTNNDKRCQCLCLDLNEMSKNKQTEIELVYDDSWIENSIYPTRKHGTIIKISKLQKRITKKTIKNLVNALSSTYRMDILDGHIKIHLATYENYSWIDMVSGEIKYDIDDLEPIQYKPLAYYYDEDFKKKIQFNISDEIHFEGKTHIITGEVGILQVGSRDLAGLTLMQNNRVILGQVETYRPKDTFGGSGTFQYQRIHGTIHLETFPVNQQKDGFSWDSGLKDSFDEKIFEIVREKTWSPWEKTLYQLAKAKKKVSESMRKSLNKEVKAKVFEEIKAIEDNEMFEYIDSQVVDKSHEGIILKFKNDSRMYLIDPELCYNKQTNNSWKQAEVFPVDNNIQRISIRINIEHTFFAKRLKDKEHLERWFIFLSIYELCYTNCMNRSESLNEMNEMINNLMQSIENNE